MNSYKINYNDEINHSESKKIAEKIGMLSNLENKSDIQIMKSSVKQNCDSNDICSIDDLIKYSKQIKPEKYWNF